jgi:hypothetical protein
MKMLFGIFTLMLLVIPLQLHAEQKIFSLGPSAGFPQGLGLTVDTKPWNSIRFQGFAGTSIYLHSVGIRGLVLPTHSKQYYLFLGGGGYFFTMVDTEDRGSYYCTGLGLFRPHPSGEVFFEIGAVGDPDTGETLVTIGAGFLFGFR